MPCLYCRCLRAIVNMGRACRDDTPPRSLHGVYGTPVAGNNTVVTIYSDHITKKFKHDKFSKDGLQQSARHCTSSSCGILFWLLTCVSLICCL